MEEKVITVPGKVLFYGGYSVLIPGHISLSLAVVDEQKKGVSAYWEDGEERIVSPQFNLDLRPFETEELVSYAYIVGKTYLKMHGEWKPIKIELENSPIFGSKEEKSGLGSSAAATVAVIKALFKANGFDVETHRETILKLSHLAYAWFSKKIGSGFDVTTAVMGQSVIYYRYDPTMVTLPEKNDTDDIKKAIEETINKPWKGIKIKPVSIPAGLLVFNIKGTSTSSISAVKAWKEWKKHNTETFNMLMKEQDEVERLAIDALLRGDFEKVREQTRKAREIHRKMQEGISKAVRSFEKVEPEELTMFIDKVEENVDGVIAGRCPGAGGKDSVAFLVEKQVVKTKDIEKIGKTLGLKLERINVKII